MTDKDKKQLIEIKETKEIVSMLIQMNDSEREVMKISANVLHARQKLEMQNRNNKSI